MPFCVHSIISSTSPRVSLQHPRTGVACSIADFGVAIYIYIRSRRYDKSKMMG